MVIVEVVVRDAEDNPVRDLLAKSRLGKKCDPHSEPQPPIPPNSLSSKILPVTY